MSYVLVMSWICAGTEETNPRSEGTVGQVSKEYLIRM